MREARGGWAKRRQVGRRVWGTGSMGSRGGASGSGPPRRAARGVGRTEFGCYPAQPLEGDEEWDTRVSERKR